jgi:hypothetical protein
LLSITSIHSERGSQTRHQYYYRFNNQNKNSFNNNNNENDGNEKQKFNSNTFSECKYNLLNSRLIETVGWVGAAIVVGLNFETRIDWSKLSSRTKSQSNANNCGSVSIAICGNCSHCTALVSRLLVSASPVKARNHVLASNDSQTNHQINGYENGNSHNNSHNKSHIDRNKGINNKGECHCLKNNSSEANHRIERSNEELNDPIDDICKQLKSASIDYIEQLNNMLGVALIQTDPEEAMQCWSNCKNSSKALFNMGVAFESGKHSSDGTVDLKRAYDHYVLSASMGHKLAIYNLSLFYLYGKGGIQVDLKRANALLERAAKLGVKPAQQFCDRLKSQKLLINRLDKLDEKPIIKTSASAPNLSIYDSNVINEKSNDKLRDKLKDNDNEYDLIFDHFKLHDNHNIAVAAI